MTLSEFTAVMKERLPTTDEVMAFVKGRAWRGWKLVAEGDAVRLETNGVADRVAEAVGRLLERDPYRSAACAELAPSPVMGIPITQVAPHEKPREWLWRTGHRYAEDPRFPETIHPGGAWWFRFAGESGWRVIEEISGVAAIGAESLFQGHGLPAGEYLESLLPRPQRQDAELVDLGGAEGKPPGEVLGAEGMHGRGHPGESGVEDG